MLWWKYLISIRQYGRWDWSTRCDRWPEQSSNLSYTHENHWSIYGENAQPVAGYKLAWAMLCCTVGTRSWSRYVQMCASYLTIQRTTLVGAFEIRFRTLVYEQLETRETLTLTPTLTPNPNPNPNGKLFESDYWHASCPLYCKLADTHLYISRPWSSGDRAAPLER